jgi:hypothetical protein
MALTAALVESTPYRLRYLLTQDGAVTSPTDPDVDALVTIPNDIGGTPDLATDASPGPLDQVINVRRNGYGPFAAGAITRTGRLSWAVDVDVDLQGDPEINVRSTAGVAGTGYLDIHFRHTYDL